MRQHGPFSHRMSFGRNVDVDARDDLFRTRSAVADGRKDQFFALPAMGDVLVDLLVRISDRRTMSAEQDREIRQRSHSLERIQIVAHVSVLRVDQDRAEADNVVAGNQRACSFIVKAELSASMSGREHRAQFDLRLVLQFQYLTIFYASIDAELISQRVRSQTMRCDGNAGSLRRRQVIVESINAGDVVRMSVRQNDFPYYSSFGD